MSYSHSFSGGSSSSNPRNMYSSQSTAAQNFAYTAAALGAQTYNWAAQTYAGNTAMTQQAVQNYLQMSQQGLGLATQNLLDYNNIYRPQMAQLANEAGSYSSAARQQVNMGAAEAQSEAGSQAGLQAAQQQLQSYGINPNSGMYAELLQSQQAAAGAAAAGAGQEAGLATQNTGRQLLQSSLQQGDQLPAAAVNALNSAYAGVAGAENSTLANANTGANMFAVPNQYLGTAVSLKYPPVGNQQVSTQGAMSNSAPGSSAAGKSGSGGGAAGGNIYVPTAATNPANQTAQPGTFAVGANSSGASQNNGSIYSPYAPGNPYAMVSPDSTGIQPFGGSNSASQFYDPYGTSGTGADAFNPSQNISGFDSQGLQTGSATIGNPTASAVPYTGASDLFGGAGGSGFGSSSNSSSGIPTTSQGGVNPGFTDQGFTSDTGNTLGGPNLSSLNPISSANAGTLNPDPYSPYTGAAASNNSGGGGTYGTYGGYASGGRVRSRGDVRHGIPLHSADMLPASVTQRMLPESFARGGIPTTGGQVPRSASPSQGRQTDDIPARLNADEFVVPRDVTKYYGHKFFIDLIKKSRTVTGHVNPPARPSMKPMSQSQMQHPRFVSRPMGR